MKAKLGRTGIIIAARLRGFRISCQDTNIGSARRPIQTVRMESERNWMTTAEVRQIKREAHCHSSLQRKMAHTKRTMQSATAGSLNGSVVACRATVKSPNVSAAKTDNL